MIKTCLICKREYSAWRNRSKYCSRTCFNEFNKNNPIFKKGTENPFWKGGIHRRKIGSIRKQPSGYIEIWTGSKWIGEHRLKMEKKIGRKLLYTEHVHHKNGIRNDNRLKNLVVLTSATHNSLEKPKQVLGWKRNARGQWT